MIEFLKKLFMKQCNKAKDEITFEQWFATLDLKHFRDYELLEKGNRHKGHGSAQGLNADPPRDKWENIEQTIYVLDQLRTKLNAPIKILSAYRSPAYNKAIGGSPRSLHMQFNAIDFVCFNGRKPTHWATYLKVWIDNGMFKGGIGVYDTFVHLDTRGKNANW